MGRYLVVAHKTAESRELLEALLRIAASDAEAEFELLVPATPSATLVSEVIEDRAIAESRAASAARRFASAGLRVTSAHAGDANVVDAIRDHLSQHSGYHALVVSTLPPGISRWLGLDVVARAERLLGKPVVHVVAESAAEQQPTRKTSQG